MKCQSCGEQRATIRYIEIVDGKKTTQWICAACAEKEGVAAEEAAPLVHGALEVFLGDLFPDGQESDEPRQGAAPVDACPECGYRFEELRQKGLLGCPHCYEVFHGQLLPMLQRFHGDPCHVGKQPLVLEPRSALRREIAGLKQRLDEAVGREEFEEAARLRDLVRVRQREVERLSEVDETGTDDTPASGATEPGAEDPGRPESGAEE